MILGVDKLLERVEKESLVDNLCERERTNPEGTGFDLRLGEIYELEGEGFLGLENRDTPQAKKIAEFDPEKEETFFEFNPGKYYLITTAETVNLPLDLTAFIVSRTTLFRSGLALFNGAVSPGYCGKLSFALCNLGGQKIKIAMGARIVHITFHEVNGKTNIYRGQWQGGRVTTDGAEKQV